MGGEVCVCVVLEGSGGWEEGGQLAEGVGVCKGVGGSSLWTTSCVCVRTCVYLCPAGFLWDARVGTQ